MIFKFLCIAICVNGSKKENVLDKMYENFSEKSLKQALAVHKGLLISVIVLPIVLFIVEYFLNDKIHFSNSMIIFLVIILWSLFNINYLKKRVKND